MIALTLAAAALLCVTPQDEAPNPHALAKQGKIDAAAKAWQGRIRKEPKNPDHRIGLVRLLLVNRRVNDALDACQAANEAIPDHYDLLLLMARLCQRKGERLAATRGGGGTAAMYFEDVANFAGKARDLAPSRREPRALIGMSKLALGRQKEAGAEADELCRRFPDHPGGFILRGEVLFASFQAKKRAGKTPPGEMVALAGRVKGAFTKAVELGPERVIPHRRLGDLAAWQGGKEVALAHYAEALARDPRRGAPLAWINENTDAAKRAAMWDKALARFGELGREPGDGLAELHWHAGLAKYRIKRWDAACEHLKKSWALRNDFLNALFWFGLAAFQAGKEDEAMVAFGMYAVKSPTELANAIRDTAKDAATNLDIVKHFADYAHKKGQAEASRELNHAIALYEDTAERWNNYAFLCRESGKYEASWAAYQKAIEKAPDDPQLINDAAVILQYHLKRDLDKAEQMYLSAIKLAKKKNSDRSTSRPDRVRFRQALNDARGNLIKMRRDKKKPKKKG